MKQKRLVFFASILAAMIMSTGNVSAAIVEYEFSFTGADLLSNVFIDGIDGSTAADNDFYDGARLMRVGTDANHTNAARTYVDSQHDTFNERWNQYTTDGYVLSEFNLWGLDGRGAHWGDDYKALGWVSNNGPANWETGLYTWPTSWGTPPSGGHTLTFPWWDGGKENGLAMDATDLASQVFSFTLKFDTNDMLWGGDTTGTGSLSAPNTLPELTFWFGGYLTDFNDEGDVIDSNLYEGNMVLTGSPIPEPTTMVLFGLGLLGMAGVSRRRRQA